MAALAIAGCSWEDENIMTDDTACTVTEKAYTRMGSGDKTREYRLYIAGRLTVDGGRYADISATFVTVEEITVRIWADGEDDGKIYTPAISITVTEPDTLTDWETMPEGVRYDARNLCEEPVTVHFNNTFRIEVSVCYVLRTKDMALRDCQADRYWKTVCAESETEDIRTGVITVPLDLAAITLNAGVEQF